MPPSEKDLVKCPYLFGSEELTIFVIVNRC